MEEFKTEAMLSHQTIRPQEIVTRKKSNSKTVKIKLLSSLICLLILISLKKMNFKQFKLIEESQLIEESRLIEENQFLKMVAEEPHLYSGKNFLV